MRPGFSAGREKASVKLDNDLLVDPGWAAAFDTI
jgi:hypothetical protein